MSIGNIKVENFDAIIFVGGSGATCYWDDPRAHKIAKEAVEQNKLLCAICFGSVILARAGVLNGKAATVWRSKANEIKKKGAIYTGNKVEVVGNIITADGPVSSVLFAETIIKKLKEK